MTPKPFQVRAFLRALFLILCAVILTGVLCGPALLSCLLDRSGQWPSFFQRLWVKALLGINGIRLRVGSAPKIDRGQACILVSNHASILDIPAMICAFPFPVRFIAKRSLIWFPIFGWFLQLSGHILIDRESAQAALRSLKKGAALLARGISIIVFAEGTRSPDGEVKEFKKGAFLLARHSRAPVVPISISGTFEMLPKSGWCFWPGIVDIHPGEPINTRNLSSQEMSGLADRVREIIIQNCRR